MEIEGGDINKMEKENIASIESSILAYEQNLASCAGVELEYESGRSTLLAQGTELAMNNLLVQDYQSGIHAGGGRLPKWWYPCSDNHSSGGGRELYRQELCGKYGYCKGT